MGTEAQSGRPPLGAEPAVAPPPTSPEIAAAPVAMGTSLAPQGVSRSPHPLSLPSNRPPPPALIFVCLATPAWFLVPPLPSSSLTLTAEAVPLGLGSFCCWWQRHWPLSLLCFQVLHFTFLKFDCSAYGNGLG